MKGFVDFVFSEAPLLLYMQFNKGHCSALIKILPGYENIYASHSR